MFFSTNFATATILKPELTCRKETVVATNEKTKLTFYREKVGVMFSLKKAL